MGFGFATGGGRCARPCDGGGGGRPPPDPEPAPTSQRADIPARREVGASGVQAHSLGRGTSGEPEALADLDENILARSSQAPFQSRVRTWPGLGHGGNYGIILIMGNAGFILLYNCKLSYFAYSAHL